MKPFIFILLLFCVTQGIAQKSTVYVNPYTKELFISEGGSQPGFLNWEKIPGDEKKSSVAKYTEQGYQFTTFPFKEEAVFGAVALLTVGLILYGLLARLKR